MEVQMAMSQKIEHVQEAFRVLHHNLTDEELVEAGLAISSCIMERLTDLETARDAREHVRAYIWGIIDAYIDGKKEVDHGRL